MKPRTPGLEVRSSRPAKSNDDHDERNRQDQPYGKAEGSTPGDAWCHRTRNHVRGGEHAGAGLVELVDAETYTTVAQACQIAPKRYLLGQRLGFRRLIGGIAGLDLLELPRDGVELLLDVVDLGLDRTQRYAGNR